MSYATKPGAVAAGETAGTGASTVWLTVPRPVPALAAKESP